MQLMIDTLKDSKADIEHALVFLGNLYGIRAVTPSIHPDDVDPDPTPFSQGVGQRINFQEPVNAPSVHGLAAVQTLEPRREQLENLGVIPRGNDAPPSADVNPFSTAPVALPDSLSPSLTVPTAPVQPASPPAAPVAPTAPVSATVPAQGVEVDSEGIPWDSRIHAATKTKIKATGAWKVKKGLNNDALLKSVREELLALRHLPAAAPAPTYVPPHAQPVMAAYSQPMNEAVPPAPPPSEPQNVAQLMPRVTVAMAQGIFTQPQLLQIVQAHGVQTIPALGHTPHLIPSIWAALKQQFPALQ